MIWSSFKCAQSLLVALICSVGVSCTPPPPAVVRETRVEDLELRAVLADVRRFHGTRVRLRGVCRIEFEGNALYLDEASLKTRNTKQGLWLNLGWPVNATQKEADGKLVTVEATIDANSTGHNGAFAGSLVNISRLEEVK